VPDLFKPTYNLTVQFPDASGLLKGSDVYLSGAVIGKVTTDPHPIPDTQTGGGQSEDRQQRGVRKDARYVIGSSGLAGDRFVDVQPVQYPKGRRTATRRRPTCEDGATIEGRDRPRTSTKLMPSAEPLIDKGQPYRRQVDDMITRLNTDVLSGTSTDDLKETIAKLREMVDNGDSMVKNANDLLARPRRARVRSDGSSTTSRSATISPPSSPISRRTAPSFIKTTPPIRTKTTTGKEKK
jgi:phospholipid/cholesterol/gamma-HCH transport system substrate-binding protein